MPRIPQETLNQILSATNIVDLVGRYVKLRRAGSSYVGLCPFHNEKSPSFNVSLSRNSYHCFGCGAGGNAFRFLMEHEGLEFMEAVKRLADAAGIRIQEEVWDANAERQAKERAHLMRVHREISVWFHQLLMRHPAAAPARDYLKSRGIHSDVARRWQLGFAPGSGAALRKWMAERGVKEDALIRSGLLSVSERDGGSRTYPKFRNRLMFPICNDQGDVIAFSGRVLPGDSHPAKYMNSPETPIFNKSRILFGFHLSRRAMLKASTALVCEGQMDLIAMFEAGFENVVAPLGTAFSEMHARMIGRSADEVVLCFDSDSAGLKAAERAFRILAPTGLSVRMAALPPGEDPDSLIQSQGKEAFLGLIESAKVFLDYQMDLFDPRRHQTASERAEFADAVAENIRYLENPVAQQVMVQQLAQRMGISEEAIESRMRAASENRWEDRDVADPDVPGSSAAGGRQLLGAQDPGSLLLASMALADAQILDWLRSELSEEFFEDIPGCEVLALVVCGDFDPLDDHSRGAFLATLKPEEEAALTDLFFQRRTPGRMPEARQALVGLRVQRLRQKRSLLQTKLRRADLEPDEAAAIQSQIVELHGELKGAEAGLRSGLDEEGS